MTYGPYTTAAAAMEGASVELDYVRRAYPAWRTEQGEAMIDDQINGFALQFGVVLEQRDDAWFWTTPDEEATLA
jgi:hypothetical protein